ncbi:MAG: DNA alkylation repair protein [Firmicutes bacterium]|nr:DNA alkylation repair protein [Bacillota bacterium]
MFDYDALRQELTANAEAGYKSFNDSLVPDIGLSYGIRLPKLRTMAKLILTSDWQSFLKQFFELSSHSHEEKLICGFVIAGAKVDFAEKWQMVKQFVSYIDNWAVCDSFCAALKQVKKNLPFVYSELQAYIFSESQFERRFAVCILMNYFLLPEYINEVLGIFAEMNSDGYYCAMGIAWALSVCYVKFPQKTEALLQKQELPPFVQNKSIQKIRESLRVSTEDKQLLLEYKI